MKPLHTEAKTMPAPSVGSGDWLGWAYARYEDSADWRGLWPTRDLAIEHGLSDYGDEECFWIAQAGPSSSEGLDFEIVGRPEKVKPNTTLSHAGTSARKQDGAATGVGSGNS